MNTDQLAKEAAASTLQYVGILDGALRFKLALAHVAQWLDNQDDSARTVAATTACEAIAQLRTVFFQG